MFLFYVGIIAGFVVITWLLVTKVSLKWYEWLIGIAGWLLAILALQNWLASFLEAEPRAGWILLLLFGIPAAILLGIAWYLPRRRSKKEAVLEPEAS